MGQDMWSDIMKRSLYPVLEPIRVNPMGVVFWSFVFALVFFLIGICTMHYPKIASVI